MYHHSTSSTSMPSQSNTHPNPASSSSLRVKSSAFRPV
nr:MAG TPA: hypothetical protein [Caudoviricetes sp.]